MPSYLYRCDQCGGELEFSHPMHTPKGVLPLCCSTPMDPVPNATQNNYTGIVYAPKLHDNEGKN